AVGIAVGLMLGIFLHDWWTTPVQPVGRATVQPQTPPVAPSSESRPKAPIHRIVMLMLTIRAMSDGIGYAANHLEHRDYYAEGERVVGQWRGQGAERLGLEGGVKSEDFEALRQGLDPRTGEFLRQRKSADRIASDGTTQ